MLMRFSTPRTNVVWITKYRYKVLNGRVAERTRDLIRKICERRDVVIVRGAVSPDHIHMLLSAPAVCHQRNWCSTSKDDHHGRSNTSSAASCDF